MTDIFSNAENRRNGVLFDPETVRPYQRKQEETMDAEQRAKFEAWAKTYPKVFTSEAGWQACLDANGVAELVEAAKLARTELRWMLDAYPERRGGKYTQALVALAAALAKHEGNGNG